MLLSALMNVSCVKYAVLVGQVLLSKNEAIFSSPTLLYINVSSLSSSSCSSSSVRLTGCDSFVCSLSCPLATLCLSRWFQLASQQGCPSQVPKRLEKQWGIFVPTCAQRQRGPESSSLMAVDPRVGRTATQALVEEQTLLASSPEGTSFELQWKHENLDVSYLVGTLADGSVNGPDIQVG